MRAGFVLQTGDWTAACLSVDSSTFSRTDFYLTAFALPLFVPTDHLFYSYGFRVGQLWDRVGEDLVREVQKSVPKLLERATLPAIVRDSADWRINPHHVEVRLGAAIISNDLGMVRSARDVLTAWQIQQPWEITVVERCRELLSLLDSAGRDQALVELARRREVTMDILR